MIRIKIELISAIDESRNRSLGTMEIHNDGSGNHDVGNYIARLHAEYTPAEGRTCKIRGFRRKRQSVWTLVGAALKKMGHTKFNG